jgi:hypothetical protein
MMKKENLLTHFRIAAKEWLKTCVAVANSDYDSSNPYSTMLTITHQKTHLFL